jgi:hypothetical protein
VKLPELPKQRLVEVLGLTAESVMELVFEPMLKLV